MGFVRRPVAADQPKPGAVLIVRNHLWRRRARQLRATRFALARADSRGEWAYARRAWRRAGTHFNDQRDSDAYACVGRRVERCNTTDTDGQYARAPSACESIHCTDRA